MASSLRTLLLLALTPFVYTWVAFAYDGPQYDTHFLLSILLKIVELRDRAISEIRRIDIEIAKNNESIQKAEKIIALAQQKNTPEARQAESVAKAALIKAQNAKRINEEIKKQWEIQKIRADRAYATIQNMLHQIYDPKRQIKGFLTNYRGNVWITKANGERTSLENGFLEPGDKVMTADGTAEIQMLDGRANVKLGPYSQLVITKDTPQEQVVELLQGKLYVAVEKVDQHLNRMKEKLHEYKEVIEKYIKDKVNTLNKEYVIRTSAAVFGVRGTKFTTEIKNHGVEVIVLEGIVDISLPEKNEVLTAEEGNRVTITSDGNIKIERVKQVEEWWSND